MSVHVRTDRIKSKVQLKPSLRFYGHYSCNFTAIQAMVSILLYVKLRTISDVMNLFPDIRSDQGTTNVESLIHRGQDKMIVY